jgi:putative FmdB family regulatory protein
VPVPIYEYRCAVCDERFEELQPATADRPACPGCGSQKVERVYSTFGTKWKPSLINWHRVP